MTPELLIDVPCRLGENPLWSADEDRLYWTDIDDGKLYRCDAVGGGLECIHDGETVGGFTRQADGSLLLLGRRGSVRILHDKRTETVIEELAAERHTRFNDVIADPAGRVFCGTMRSGGQAGALYRLEIDGRMIRVLEDVGCSNGIGFSPDLATMYYTDSPRREVYAFDYGRQTGDISNQRVFASVPDGQGVPDGLTVDAEGGVWSARWDGGCIVRYDPAGRRTHRVELPARRVTSAMFGGPDLADLYVTTAGGDDRRTHGRLAGAIFRLRPPVGGREEFPSRVRL